IPVAPATGASINPARTLGPMFVQQLWGGEVEWGQAPVYLAAEICAGIAAALIYVAMTRTRELPEAIAATTPARPTSTSV
ncbi:MAG: aquaporin, partial [Pseudonocardiaceae bacterium]